MPHAKHRTQISLEDWQYQALLEISGKTRKSLSGIVRELITEKYAKRGERAESDPIFGIVGIGKGDGSSCAKEHDRFLYGKKR